MKAKNQIVIAFRLKNRVQLLPAFEFLRPKMKRQFCYYSL